VILPSSNNVTNASSTSTKTAANSGVTGTMGVGGGVAAIQEPEMEFEAETKIEATKASIWVRAFFDFIVFMWKFNVI
jgi:hypothetical protein